MFIMSQVPSTDKAVLFVGGGMLIGFYMLALLIATNDKKKYALRIKEIKGE